MFGRLSSMSLKLPQEEPIPKGVKIVLVCLMAPVVALGIALILMCFGYFTEVMGTPPMGIFIPFTIIYNGVIGLFLFYFVLRKLQARRLAEQIPMGDSPSSTSFSSEPETSFNSTDEDASLPPEVALKIQRAKLLAFWIPLGLLLCIIIYAWVYMINGADSIEQLFGTVTSELIFGFILIAIFIIGAMLLSRSLRRLKENPSF